MSDEQAAASPERSACGGDLVCGAVIFLIALYVLIESIRMPFYREGLEGFLSSPGFTPGLIAVGLLVLSAALMLRSRHVRLSFGVRTLEVETIRVMTVFGIIFAYILAMPWIGYVAATFLMMLAFQLIFAKRRREPFFIMVWGIGLSALITAALYALFGLFFLIPLP